MIKQFFCYVLLFVVSLTGCASRSQDEIEDRKPDDAISISICESKPDNFYYIGHTTNTDNLTTYLFRGENLTAETVCEFSNAVTATSFDGYGKIEIDVVQIEEYGFVGAFSISNYSNDFIYSANFEDLCVLKIVDSDTIWECVHDPQTYTGISGIKYLIVEEWFQRNAEEAEIDWYEVWPDLEGIEVRK